MARAQNIFGPDEALRVGPELANLVKPVVNRRAADYAFKFLPQERLHRLPVAGSAHRQFVADSFRHIPNRDLHSHASIMQSMQA